jgi:hypothetical protein
LGSTTIVSWFKLSILQTDSRIAILLTTPDNEVVRMRRAACCD